MTDARAWLDQVDAIHNQVIRNDPRAEWQRLTAEHDALPAATAALRAVLDLAEEADEVARRAADNNPEWADAHSTMAAAIRAAITTAPEDA